MLNFKKAAMFGLDARVTLMIFTAIGAISFVSFYRNITEVDTTQYITDMNSIKQSYQNFRTDTSYKLTSYTNPYFYNVSELVTLAVDNNKPYTKKYQGPYLDYILTGTNNLIKHPTLNLDIAFVSRSMSADWATQAHPNTVKCSANDCFTWLVIYNVPASSATEIDIKVDKVSDANNGKIRLKANGSNFDVFMPIIKE